MARPPTITRESLAPLIRARGPISTTELAALLKVNRTTIARTLPELGDELVTLGATRSTRYLLRRNVRDIGNQWPLYRITAAGRASEWARLEALHDRHWQITWTGNPPAWAAHFTETNGLWSGFPFFLHDARPQGFLGRILARRLSRTLQVPDDPRIWSDEDTLVFLESEGENQPGDIVVGDTSLRNALASATHLTDDQIIAESERSEQYPIRAKEIAETLPGSSAGGEQPKFLTTLRDNLNNFRSVLVKFTAPLDQAVAQRWADLLTCEFHAHQVLAEAGLAMPGARLLDAGGRRFLEAPRFDRQGAGGRIGVVSMEALAASLLGTQTRNWSEVGNMLHRDGFIDAATLNTIHVLQNFGELIGNTDMHLGNLAFFLSDTLPFRLTPSYDMLPMLWAPGAQGELIERRFAPQPPIPSMAVAWRTAAELAKNFWQQLAEDPRLSPAFAQIARNAITTIAILKKKE